MRFASAITCICGQRHVRKTLIEEIEEFTPEDRIGIVSLMDHTPGQRQFVDTNKLKGYLQGKYGLTDDQFDAHVAHQQGLYDKFGAEHEAAVVAAANRLGAVLASHDDTTAEHVTTSEHHGVRIGEFPTTRLAAEACHDVGIAVVMGRAEPDARRQSFRQCRRS